MSYSYTLCARQTSLYRDTCSIYKPTTGASVLRNNEAPDPKTNATADYSDIPFLWETKSDFVDPAPGIGRTTRDLAGVTLDIMHFHVDQDLGSQYMIKITTSGSSEAGAWFVVMGDPMRKRRFANKQSVFVKRINKPKGVT